jgi:hypothetical protein
MDKYLSENDSTKMENKKIPECWLGAAGPVDTENSDEKINLHND